MKELYLTDRGIKDPAWKAAGYKMPAFDRAEMKARTAQTPQWVHFGGGNIFRAFIARAAQTLLDGGKMKSGVIAAEGYDPEITEKCYKPFDDLSLLVTLCGDGKVEKTVVGSIAASCDIKEKTLEDVFAASSLQMASFTITEKGYAVRGADGTLLPWVTADIEAGPETACGYLGRVTALLYKRFTSGGAPIAMVSMDNCSRNGEKLRDAVMTHAAGWTENGKADAAFIAYLNEKVSFPCTMIDKITPRPDPAVAELLTKDGVRDIDPVVTAKGSFIAPFVNAEESEYLVLEDVFPNGRPPLENAGWIFTDRATVDKTERMKVCTCLNPLHTALAVFGCLLGYDKISAEMKDDDLVALIKKLGYEEGLPVVTDPGVLDPRAFIDTVIGKRLPNPFLPDSPQRIATDTSQKLAIRFGETIKAYGERAGTLNIVPLVLAGWLRYLLAVDDKGDAFTPSGDPRLAEARAVVAPFSLGNAPSAETLKETLSPLLRDETLFGTDLFTVGLADKVCESFASMIRAPGAVRKTIQKAI